MHIPEAVNLFLNTSLCVLVTHFISCVIETAWDMWGIFRWWKKVFNKLHHHWLYGAIWWATNVFIRQLHSLIRYSLGKSIYKYGKTKFGELSAVIFHRDWSIVHIPHWSSGKSLFCSTWTPYISAQCPDMSLASSVKSSPPSPGARSSKEHMSPLPYQTSPQHSGGCFVVVLFFVFCFVLSQQY